MSASLAPKHPNLGFYTLAGAPESPRDLIEEVTEGERLGFGTTFISERFNTKEAATLSGAAGAVTQASTSSQARRTTTLGTQSSRRRMPPRCTA